MILSNIKLLMKEKKLNVREFAELTGMSTATINKARRDNGILECRLSTLVRIADALGQRFRLRLEDELVLHKIIDRAAERRDCVQPEFVMQTLGKQIANLAFAVVDEHAARFRRKMRGPFDEHVHVAMSADAGELLDLCVDANGLAKELDLFRAFQKGSAECARRLKADE